MQALLAVAIGALYAGGIYLMMRRSIVKLLLGVNLLAHAANLLVFTSAGLTRGRPPIIEEGEVVASPALPDPLAQAIVLTAIVISFGLLAFAVALIYRTYRSFDTEDIDELGGGT